MNRQEQIAALEKDWAENPRWSNVKRGYIPEDVVRSSLSTRWHAVARKSCGSW